MKVYLSYRKWLICAVSLLLVLKQSAAQDLHFSQFFEAPLLRNPSLAGIFTGDYRVQGVYRDQWNSITDGYRTGSFNAEYKMPVAGNDFITTGLQVLYDKAGTVGLTTTEIMPALNYHKSLSDYKTMYLSLGFMGGYVGKTIDRSKVTTNNQFDGNAFNPSIPDGETFPTPNIHYLDGSVGMSFNTSFGQDEKNNLYIGAAYHHLNRPRNSFYKDASQLDPKYVFSAGVKLSINEYTWFTLQADHSMQGAFKETIGGTMFSYKLGDDPENSPYTLNLGGYIRVGDALIPVLKLDTDPLSIAISYDVNISQLKTVSEGRGGFELSISYIGFLERNNTAKYKMLSPRF
jgi:type IX secretion system PorP/SprF family membrane protein